MRKQTIEHQELVYSLRMSDNTLTFVLLKTQTKNICQMAKVSIKTEKASSFRCIFL